MTHEQRDSAMHWWNAAVYGGCAYYFGVSVLWCALIATAAFIYTQWDYGHSRRAIYILGSIILFVTLVVGSGLVSTLLPKAANLYSSATAH
jgi:hypothetical protein